MLERGRLIGLVEQPIIATNEEEAMAVTVRPLSGAATCENSRSSWASRIAALAVSIAATALRWSAVR